MLRLVGTTHLTSDGAKSPLKFALKNCGGMPLWNRALTINGVDAFYVGNVCDTCGFFFEKLIGPNSGLEIDDLRTKLEIGTGNPSTEVLGTLAQLMPKSDYTVATLKVLPEHVRPLERGDYFAQEDFDYEDDYDIIEYGPPEPHNPKTEYYRISGRSGVSIEDESASGNAFDFIIPLIARQSLDQDRIDYFKDAISRGQTTTAVALSVLDIKGPSSKDRVHWCLAHYVLDGHHKLAAAAETKSEITLLAFIALAHGVSSPSHVERLLDTFPM